MLNSFIKRQIGRKFKGSHKILYFSEDVNFNRQLLLVSSFWTLPACNQASAKLILLDSDWLPPLKMVVSKIYKNKNEKSVTYLVRLKKKFD